MTLESYPPAADWKVCIKGTVQFEVSICRESFHHGFRSFGWGKQDRKVILFSMDSYDKPSAILDVMIKYRDAHLIPFAQACADAMNHVESQALLKP